jgi:hypothetical protein
MKEVWSDIEAMLTPSWITSVPKNLGSPSHGKVKADQWRVLGTMYLPVSLVRLWGKARDGDERSERCRKILNSTISLLSAVIVASSRVTSASRADLYLQHMQAYLSGIQSLFPEYKLHPNHHMALHLHEYLMLFGPVHAWWTFPFERIIGMLQRIPTNSKIGKTCFGGVLGPLAHCSFPRRTRGNSIKVIYSLFELTRRLVQITVSPSFATLSGHVRETCKSPGPQHAHHRYAQPIQLGRC